MEKLNVLGLETKNGYRTFELYNGDLSKLDRNVDVLIVSAFRKNYAPIKGTLIGSLYENCNLSVDKLSLEPDMNFRDSLGFWISKEINDLAFKRILCLEIIGSEIPISEIIRNAFIGLTIIEAKGLPIKNVAMPIIGAGNQRLNPETILRNLLPAAKDYLDRSQRTEALYFVEKNPEYASICSNVMNDILGRHHVVIPHSQLLSSITEDVHNKILQANDLFLPDHTNVRDDLLRLCHSKEIHLVELGVSSRKLVEIIVKKLGFLKSSLYNSIRELHESGSVAPWICGYMNVLRHIGNEEAHSGDHNDRVPPYVDKTDLALTLMCVQRLLEFWIEDKPIKKQE